MSATGEETLTPNPNKCNSTLTSGTRGIYPHCYILMLMSGVTATERSHRLRIRHAHRRGTVVQYFSLYVMNSCGIYVECPSGCKDFAGFYFSCSLLIGSVCTHFSILKLQCRPTLSLSLMVNAKILRILPVFILPADCFPGSN